ncbi:hypothetical protein HanPI659440_Chr09g0322601 [Helianthus annuus]|nr:hypothetical protein HanPI659440_Chr09g0322601 [Helianthus annuus]
MGDKISDDKLHDDQDSEAVETISLTDFPISQHQGADRLNPPPSSAAEDFFEFFGGGLSDNCDDKSMSHAEDIIFCGKLVPINEQLHRNDLPQTNSKIPLIAELLVGSTENETKFSVTGSNCSRHIAHSDSEKHQFKSQHNQPNQPVGCRRSRSESMADVKRAASPPVRTSRSLDYKRLHRNSSMSSESVADISRDGSGKKSSSSRWYVLLFGLVKVPPPEMDIRDIKNRQVRRTSSKSPLGPSESVNMVPVSRSVDHRKCSWKVLGFLSCKSSSSAAVTMPVGYMPKV